MRGARSVWMIVCLCIVAAAGLGLPSAAEEPGDGPFAQLPTTDPVYRMLDALDGLVDLGYEPGALNGSRSLTRYEVSVALQRVLQTLPERLAEVAPRAGGRRILVLRAHADSRPFLSAPAGTLRKELGELHEIYRKWRPLLELMGAEWATVDRSLTVMEQSVGRARLSLGLGRRSAPTGRPFNRASLDSLSKGDAGSRTRLLVDLLTGEVELPSSPEVRSYFTGVVVTGHHDYLGEILQRVDAGSMDLPIFLSARQAAPEGELKECLTLACGLAGDQTVRPELVLYAGDPYQPVPLRIQAVRALSVSPTEADLRRLIRVAQEDPVVTRWSGGCLGPATRTFPVRLAAVRALSSSKAPKSLQPEVERAARAITSESGSLREINRMRAAARKPRGRERDP